MQEHRSRPELPAPALADVVRRTVDLPPLLRVRRSATEDPPPGDPGSLTELALAPHLERVARGDTVALAVGSRGVAGIAAIVRTCVQLLRSRGATVFIVPAMGSHGGATAEGQQEVLASLGVTEQSVAAPVRASMDVQHLGVADDIDVYVDRHAAAADHVLLINRVKSHTSYSGQVESGLAKMLAVGLGKQRGAEEIHRRGPAHLEARIRAAGQVVRAAVPVLGGLAVVEDAHKSVHAIEFLAPDEIGGDGEARLLETAKAHESRLPFAQLDVLVVDLMGKEISGTGMDTNVLGRRMVRGMDEPEGIAITNVVVLDVSAASEGNAVGIGLADFAPARALAGVDLVATYANALTAGLQGVQRAQLPIVLQTDHDAVCAAVLAAGLSEPEQVRMARIRSTLALDELMVTPNLMQECNDRYAPLAPGAAEAEGWFQADGRVRPWPESTPGNVVDADPR